MYRTVAMALTTTLLLLLGSHARADLELAAQLIEEQRYQAALDALDQQPASRQARLLRANAMAGLKRSDEAEGLYRALIDEAPQDPTPYNNLAALYAASGRLQEASELLTRAMKSDERYAAVYKNLSRVYVEMSRNAYAKALRMGEPQQGLQLIALDHRAEAPAPIQLAAVESRPAEVVLPTPAPQPVPVEPVAPTPQPVPAEIVAPAASEAAVESPSVADSDNFDAGGAIAALQQWAAAWSGQDVDGYLAAYDRDFLPPRDLSRGAWEAERRLRLKRPKKIEVNLSDFEVSSTGGNSLTVKLLQRYRSDSYRDTTRKGFILVRRNGQWKIGDEYTIEVIK